MQAVGSHTVHITIPVFPGAQNPQDKLVSQEWTGSLCQIRDEGPRKTSENFCTGGESFYLQEAHRSEKHLKNFV